jgi:putative salt-induced outer membrane protein YdiY
MSLFILLTCFSFTYDNTLNQDIVLSVGDMNNEIGTKINNSVNLQGYVHVNDKEAGKSIATQVGITGAMAAGALGVSKAIAKSPMPPLQKAGIVVGSAAGTGLLNVGINIFNNALSKNVSTSTTGSNTSINSNVTKFLDGSQSSPLQDIV